jgi:hypothetical protein
VLVLDANPEIQSKKSLFERAFAQYHAGILEYRPNAELKEGDGNLDHRKEAPRITHELLGTLGAAIARFRELVETRAANRDKGNFGTNEESVDEDQ